MSGAFQALASALTAILRQLEGLAIRLAVALLVFLLILMNVEVAGRYLLGFSTLIADEYGGYSYVWIVMLGAVHLLRSDRYLTMTLVIDRFPKLRNAFGILAAVVGLAVSAVSLESTFDLVDNSWRFGTRSINPSSTLIILPQFILPFGFLMLCFAYVEELVRRFAGLPPRRNDDDPDTYGEGEAV